MVQPVWKIVWQFLKQLNTQLKNDLAIPLPGVYLRETKMCLHRNQLVHRCSALFIIAQTGNNSNTFHLVNI